MKTTLQQLLDKGIIKADPDYDDDDGIGYIIVDGYALIDDQSDYWHYIVLKPHKGHLFIVLAGDGELNVHTEEFEVDVYQKVIEV